MNKAELVAARKEIKRQLWDVEQILKNKTYVSAVDFASMYPSVIRLLNASIESLVGFLNDDPIAYRELGISDIMYESVERSKELIKSTIHDSKYVKFVGKKENKVALRRDIYAGKYDNAPIEEITETPFERFFLASMGLYDSDEVLMKFQGQEYTVTELNQHLKDMDYSVSGSGAIFKRSVGEDGELGLVPSYLAFMFNERKNVKKEMGVHIKRKVLLQTFRKSALDDGLL